MLKESNLYYDELMEKYKSIDTKKYFGRVVDFPNLSSSDNIITKVSVHNDEVLGHFAVLINGDVITSFDTIIFDDSNIAKLDYYRFLKLIDDIRINEIQTIVLKNNYSTLALNEKLFSKFNFVVVKKKDCGSYYEFIVKRN